MEINISDSRIVARLKKLASQLNQTPEQIVTDAIDRYEPHLPGSDQSFWDAMCGIGSSDEPDLALHIKEILRSEVDPIKGWGTVDGPKDPDRR